MVEELGQIFKKIKERLQQLRGHLDIESTRRQIDQIEFTMSQPSFWSDTQLANLKIQELKGLKATLEPFISCEKEFSELYSLTDIVDEEDKGSIGHIKTELEKLSKEIDSIEFKKLLSEPDDCRNAILSINAGAGGTESCDWAAMLLRMYTRWAEDKGFSVQTIDYLVGEEAGIKNVTIILRGPYAYGYLKAEEGVHRLIRISPFDSNKRRHTSFASVDVVPEVEEEIDIKIEEKDLRIDTFRSSGRGGQHVNVTDSAVRVTHLPTGIVVSCQDERSQYKNKQMAMKVLKARLYQRQKEGQRKQLQTKYDSKQEIAWGSQIRSYVMHPYSLVKDHRTNYETSNVNAVLNGDIDAFIENFLKWKIKR